MILSLSGNDARRSAKFSGEHLPAGVVARVVRVVPELPEFFFNPQPRRLAEEINHFDQLFALVAAVCQYLLRPPARRRDGEQFRADVHKTARATVARAPASVRAATSHGTASAPVCGWSAPRSGEDASPAPLTFDPRTTPKTAAIASGTTRHKTAPPGPPRATVATTAIGNSTPARSPSNARPAPRGR